MSEIVIRVHLPDEHIQELEKQAAMCQITTNEFCSQAIQATLAARILSELPPTTLGKSPRVPGWKAEPETESEDVLEYEDATPLEPADVCTVEELGILDDIQS